MRIEDEDDDDMGDEDEESSEDEAWMEHRGIVDEDAEAEGFGAPNREGAF